MLCGRSDAGRVGAQTPLLKLAAAAANGANRLPSSRYVRLSHSGGGTDAVGTLMETYSAIGSAFMRLYSSGPVYSSRPNAISCRGMGIEDSPVAVGVLGPVGGLGRMGTFF